MDGSDESHHSSDNEPQTRELVPFIHSVSLCNPNIFRNPVPYPSSAHHRKRRK